MTEHSFFALIARMKYIARWGLMRSSEPENVQEHSHMTAVLAHALAVIRRDVFGVACDPGSAALLALYHDASEILTGDLPTPIKYNNEALKLAYKQVEETASEKLLELLPAELRGAYEPLLKPEAENPLLPLVKAADKLAAYIKCVEERRAGNDEFRSAEALTLRRLHELALPELDYFLERFAPAFEKNLDELRTMEYRED